MIEELEKFREIFETIPFQKGNSWKQIIIRLFCNCYNNEDNAANALRRTMLNRNIFVVLV